MRSALGCAALGLLLLIVAGTFDAEPLYVTGAALLLLGAGAGLWIGLGGVGAKLGREISVRSVIEDQPLQVKLSAKAGRIPLPPGWIDEPLLPEPVRLPAGRRQAWQQGQQLVDVALLVEHVRGQHERPGPTLDHFLRLVPAAECGLQPDAVQRSIGGREAQGVGRPVGGQHRCAAKRGRDRRQAQPAAQLQRTHSAQITTGEMSRQRPRAGP